MNSDDLESKQTEPTRFLQCCKQVEQLQAEIAKVLIGQTSVVNEVLVALLAGGHVLIEGVPGLGKTLLVKALARCMQGDFARIQFTPDLMPSDVTGHTLYNLREEKFKVRKGPIFTHLLLADEINRAPAKTQAALLEVMQEMQVTIEGKSYGLEAPFMVLATQNPLEQEGTYPLPEAQLDRFLLKIKIDYPSKFEEQQLVTQVTLGQTGDRLDVQAIVPILMPSDILQLQHIVADIKVDPEVINYAVNIVQTTRQWGGIHIGAGPRGSIALIRSARANALLNARNFVIPDDIKAVTASVLRHRLTLSAEMEIEGQSIDTTLKHILNKVEAPRQ